MSAEGALRRRSRQKPRPTEIALGNFSPWMSAGGPRGNVRGNFRQLRMRSGCQPMGHDESKVPRDHQQNKQCHGQGDADGQVAGDFARVT
jgi:hypothetical protein